MSALDNFRFVDVAGRARDAYDDIKTVRTDQARMRAGNALSGGDYRGAAGALFEAGDVDGGARVAYYGDRRAEDDRQAKAAREKAATEAWGQAAERLSRILDESKDDPSAVLGAFDTYFAPRLQSLGETPDEVAQVRGMIQQSPRQALLALGAGAAKKLGYDTSVVGDELMVTSKDTGQVIGRYRGGRTLNVPEGGAVYDIPGGGGPVGQDPSQYRTPDFNPQVQRERPAPDMGEVGPATTGRDAASMMEALIAQESGGNGNAVGPQTPYGQAQGSTQMLMATAESMARKLGVPWRPDLMRGDTPNALAYQRRLGQAYLQEGLDKYNGDPAQALRYYHGGPDERLWGPKTNAYAEAVMGRMGEGGQPLAGGDGADTVQGDGQGPRLLVQRPKGEKPTSRPATADEKARYGIPQNVPAQIKPDGTFDVIDLPKGVADKEKADQAQQAQILKARDIIGTVDTVLKNVGWGESGLVGQKMSDVAGTKAYDVARQIETIKANLGFQELQQMRAMSPTGGALGAIAVQELVALQSTVANLDIGQSEAQLRSNLERIKAHYQRWLSTIDGKSAPGGRDGVVTVRTPEEARALPPGTRFRTPDGRLKVR